MNVTLDTDPFEKLRGEENGEGFIRATVLSRSATHLSFGLNHANTFREKCHLTRFNYFVIQFYHLISADFVIRLISI